MSSDMSSGLPQKERESFFSMFSMDRTRNKRFKMQLEKFRLDIGRNK